MTAGGTRDALTVTVAVSAGVHAALVPEHWHERPVLGVGFALAAGALAATGTALHLNRLTPIAPAMAGLLLAGLTALYLLSRTAGLPLTGHEEWDTVGIATQFVQLTGVALAIRPLTRTTRTRGGSHAHVTHA
jgi:hypothetical protein